MIKSDENFVVIGASFLPELSIRYPSGALKYDIVLSYWYGTIARSSA